MRLVIFVIILLFIGSQYFFDKKSIIKNDLHQPKISRAQNGLTQVIPNIGTFKENKSQDYYIKKIINYSMGRGIHLDQNHLKALADDFLNDPKAFEKLGSLLINPSFIDQNPLQAQFRVGFIALSKFMIKNGGYHHVHSVTEKLGLYLNENQIIKSQDKDFQELLFHLVEHYGVRKFLEQPQEFWSYDFHLSHLTKNITLRVVNVLNYLDDKHKVKINFHHLSKQLMEI